MSKSSYVHEARRWLATAADDLKAARVLQKGGMYAHACFNAQQSAEKAVKAVWYWAGHDPWGHSIQKLVQDLPSAKRTGGVKKLVEDAAALDRFYIPTRYPNGLPDLTPSANYLKADGTEAISKAASLVQACRAVIS